LEVASGPLKYRWSRLQYLVYSTGARIGYGGWAMMVAAVVTFFINTIIIYQMSIQSQLTEFRHCHVPNTALSW
jgi:hypothetical protein